MRAWPAVLLLMGSHAFGRGAPEPEGFWTGDIHAPTPRTLHGGTVVHAKGLPALISQGAVIVDTSNLPHRPDNLAADSVWLPVPHKAIPGAVWIPGAGDGEISASVDALFRNELLKRTTGNRDVPLIIYCHETCWLSWNAAKRAIRYGYQRVYWFAEGIEGWSAAHQPASTVEATRPPE